MAVVSIKLDSDPVEGSAEKDRRSYQLKYVAITTDINDGVIAIRQHADCPKVNSTYAYKSEIDAKAYCVGVDVKPRSGRQNEDELPDGLWAWDVVAKYQAEGDGSENPLLKPAVLSFDTEQYDAPFERDLDGNACLNSAGMPFDPPLVREDNHWIIRIEKNLPWFDASFADSVQNSVNSDDFLGASPGTLRLKKISAAQKESETIGSYFAAVAELQFRRIEYPGHEPHQSYPLDQGRYFIGARDIIHRGQVVMAPILDNQSPPQPVHDPVPLDGTGQPLARGATPVYLFFRQYPSFPFNSLGIYP